MTDRDKIADDQKNPKYPVGDIQESHPGAPWREIVKQVKTMVVDDAKFSAMDISRVIEQDPVLAAKIMKTAGAFFKDNADSKTVVRAVVMLGTQRIYNLAISQRMWREA